MNTNTPSQSVTTKAQSEGSLTTEILNYEECAKFTRLSVSTIKRLVYANDIPFTRKGGRVLFVKEKVRNWLLDDKGA